jgi:hypothetical protein
MRRRGFFKGFPPDRLSSIASASSKTPANPARDEGQKWESARKIAGAGQGESGLISSTEVADF